MAIDPDIAPDPCNPAIRTDQNRGAKNSLESPAIHGFFAPGAIRLQDLVLLIRKERRGEPMLVPKGFLRLWRVGGNTEDSGLAFRKRARQPREVDGLPGAAWRVRARIEKKHEFSAREVGQRNGAAAVARQAEGRRFCALGQSLLARGRRVSCSARRFRSQIRLRSCRALWGGRAGGF